MTYNADSRPLTVTLAGKGPFIATELKCTEALSKNFDCTLNIVTPEEIDGACLGKLATAEFEQAEQSTAFTGLIKTLEYLDYNLDKDLYYYRVELCDALSLLALRVNRQIFQNVSSKRIVETILADSGVKSYVTLSVSGEGAEHEYYTQMDETDLDFIQRIMASEGWHYRIDRNNSSHKIEIADSNQAFSSLDNSPYTFQKQADTSSFCLTNWRQKSKVTTSKLTLADFNHELTECIDSGEQSSSADNPQSDLASYQYGASTQDKSLIRDAAKVQMEALDASKQSFSSNSNIAEICSGTTFKLSGHPISANNSEYLVVSVIHQIKAQESGRDFQYRNKFECIPNSTPFRAEQVAKPKVACMHSAFVTGPSNEEIYTDDQGRIKVQFHWDKLGKNDENTSCWLPVSQNFASKGFGVQFTPRIGDEVLVSYINGDPNLPVVSGGIYNPTNLPPFDSPTQSGIRTRTTPDGSSQTSNEIRFDDQKDKEELYIHAQKDLLVEVTNDSTSTITGMKAVNVEKTIDVNSKEDFTAATEKNFSASSKEAMSLASDKTFAATSKDDLSAASDKNISLESGANTDVKATASISIDGQDISLAGKTKIALSVGASTIELSASGIKIDAPQIAISGQAKAELKAAMVTVEGQGKADVKGAMVTVEGSAMTQVKAGAMVQIQGAIAKVN